MAVWTKKVVQAAGMSLAEASRRMGLPSDALSKVGRKDRDLTVIEMAQLAELTRAEFFNPLLEDGLRPRYVKVVGEVAAGLWRDVNRHHVEDNEFIALVDARWPKEAIFGWTVRGESINRKAADGDRVVGLMLEYAPRSIQTGDWVIVDRIKLDLCERTVKRAKRLDDGSWELWPDSFSPEFQEPLLLGEHDNEVVLVVAFVLDFVSTATKI